MYFLSCYKSVNLGIKFIVLYEPNHLWMLWRYIMKYMQGMKMLRTPSKSYPFTPICEPVWTKPGPRTWPMNYLTCLKTLPLYSDYKYQQQIITRWVHWYSKSRQWIGIQKGSRQALEVQHDESMIRLASDVGFISVLVLLDPAFDTGDHSILIQTYGESLVRDSSGLDRIYLTDHNCPLWRLLIQELHCKIRSTTGFCPSPSAIFSLHAAFRKHN